MSTIAEFTVPSESFVLSTTLGAVPEMRVEVERVVAHDNSGSVTPYFWATGGNYTEFERALHDDPTIENVITLDELEGGHLYRAEWTKYVDSIVYAISDVKATVLDATGQGDEWNVRMLFPSDSTLSDFHDYCATYDLSFELARVYNVNQQLVADRYGLTDEQRETLAQAHDRGYFDVPRDVTLGELADDIGVSHQAVSERLRRGLETLISNALKLDT